MQYNGLDDNKEYAMLLEEIVSLTSSLEEGGDFEKCFLLL
jgi:hypothetical protein